MRILTILILCICTLGYAAPSSLGGTQLSIPRKLLSDYDFPGLKKKVPLDSRDSDILSILQFFAIQGDLNIVTSKNVTGKLTFLINDVTIADALEIILSMSNLAYEVQGNVIKIMPVNEYKILHGRDFRDNRQTVIHHLKYASAGKVANLLGNVKSDFGKIVFDDSTGTLVLMDFPDKIRAMEGVIEQSDIATITRVLPTETWFFELNYARVEDVKEAVTGIVSPEIGSVQIDLRTNTLAVTDLPHQKEKIEALIKAFDRKTREVFIEAKIVEVTLSDTFSWGIDFTKIIKYGDDVGGSKGRTLQLEGNLPLGLSNFGKLSVTTLSHSSLDAVLELLKTVTDIKILSNPHLTVEEGKTAVIKVIEKQPYAQETTVAAGSSITGSKEYVFVDIGVMLEVTPRINADGFISMKIIPEVSSISAWYGGAAQAAGAVPVVKSANAETTVTIKDGVTIMIAGLIKDNKTKTVNRIPGLSRIPIIGKLFQSTSDDIRRTETIIFLTPRIVEGDRSFLLIRDMEKKIKGIRK